jgi:hypothetical protein
MAPGFLFLIYPTDFVTEEYTLDMLLNQKHQFKAETGATKLFLIIRHAFHFYVAI